MLIKFDSLGKRLALLISMFVLVALVAREVIKISVANEYAGHALRVEGYEKALLWDGANSEYYYNQGRFHHYAIDSVDLSRAVASYNRAIKLNPLVAKYWLDLGKAYEELKMWADAEQAFSMAIQLNARSPQVRWEAANFWLRRGHLENAFSNFKAAAESDYKKLNAAMNLCWKVTEDRERILREVIPDTVSGNLSFLNFALDKKDYAIAAHAWARVLENNDSAFQADSTFAYIDALVHAGQIPQAQRVWRQTINKCGLTRGAIDRPYGMNLVYNGSFERALLNGGFDWRVMRDQGFSSSLDSHDRIKDYRSMKIEFDGKTNIDFYHLYQIVPLARERPRSAPDSTQQARVADAKSFLHLASLSQPMAPGKSPAPQTRKFVFSYYIKTQDVSTDQGVFWEIVDYPKERSLRIRSEPYLGTDSWRRREMEFSVDATIQSIMIRLRRLPSQKFDSLFKGKVWLDGVELIEN